MGKKRMLVVFYSRTGNTRKVASAIAGLLGCETEEITEEGSRAGLVGFVRSFYHALRRHHAAIQPPVHDPASYDLVLVGTPVWGASVSAPVRTYLHDNRHRLSNLAFFCTYGMHGSDQAFAQMQQIAGKPPAAVVAILSSDIDTQRCQAMLSEFVARLQKLQSTSSLSDENR